MPIENQGVFGRKSAPRKPFARLLLRLKLANSFKEEQLLLEVLKAQTVPEFELRAVTELKGLEIARSALIRGGGVLISKFLRELRASAVAKNMKTIRHRDTNTQKA